MNNGYAHKKLDDICAHAPNKHLCLPQSYSKFEAPFSDPVNVVEIGIDISDVLRINDKVLCKKDNDYNKYDLTICQQPVNIILHFHIRE